MKIMYLIPPSEGKNKTVYSSVFEQAFISSSSLTSTSSVNMREETQKTYSPPAPLQERGETATFPLLNKEGIGEVFSETLSFLFSKPKKIALHATEKDLKCTGKRYEEAREMNRKICQTHFYTTPLPNPLLSGEGNIYNDNPVASSLLAGERRERCYIEAITRYSGVMYSAINYEKMNQRGKEYFDEHFLILSGMYGLLRPQDIIGNYKLPIETKGLKDFWQKKITKTLNELEVDIIVDLLPGSYKKMIDWKKLGAKVVQVEFLERKEKEVKKMTHNVKKVKGEYIKKICEQGFTDLPDTLTTAVTTLEVITSL